MKAIFDRQTLERAITPALGTVSSKNTMPSIEGILMTAKSDNTCEISGYDLEKGYRTTIAAKVFEEGSYIINADRLVRMVKVMPDGDLEVAVDKKNLVKISSGKSLFELVALDGSTFPALPTLSGDRGFTMTRGELRRLISQVTFAIAQNDNRPALNGAFFKIKGGSITVVACDGNRLALREKICGLENIVGGEPDMNFIIPGKTLSELMRLISDDEKTLTIELARKHVIFNIDGSFLFSRLIDGEYIDYERIIPKSFKTWATVPRERFIEGLERAQLVAEEGGIGRGGNSVRCEFDDSLLKIRSNSQSSSVYDEMFVDMSGDSLEIGFNCRYLLDALKTFPCEEVKLSLISPKMSVVMEPKPDSDEEAEDSRLLQLVLPVHLN